MPTNRRERARKAQRRQVAEKGEREEDACRCEHNCDCAVTKESLGGVIAAALADQGWQVVSDQHDKRYQRSERVERHYGSDGHARGSAKRENAMLLESKLAAELARLGNAKHGRRV